MELSGAIEGLRFIQKLKGGEVIIKTDSQYVIKGMTEWIDGWIKRGWKGSTKKPVLNRELWEELLKLSLPFKIKWEYVKGHAGIAGNERADEIATKFADRGGSPLLWTFVQLSNKKITTAKPAMVILFILRRFTKSFPSSLQFHFYSDYSV